MSTTVIQNKPNYLPSDTVTSHKTWMFIKNITVHILYMSTTVIQNTPNYLPSDTVMSHKTWMFIKNKTVHVLYMSEFRNSLVLIRTMHETSDIQWEI
jgi:hypothetical protein